MASYNVVESNDAFFHNLVENYVDIVFANESEAKAFTKMEPREAIDELAKQCQIAVVKVGKEGSMVKSGDEYHFIEPWPANPIDATGAGDTYAAGFLDAHSLGMPLKVCGEIVARYGYHKVSTITLGGKERYHSVYQGLLSASYDENDEKNPPAFVLIHDGARPFVTEEIIQRNMEVL